MQTASPAHTSEFADAGDEVQRRFRCQINYSALKALQLLATEVSIRAIYCEQVEDLLIERLDGKFVGIQIKTRDLNQGPFKSSDEPIVRALSRFCVRDARFRGWFALFILATNFAFYESNGPDDLRKILSCVQNNPTLAGLPIIRVRKRTGDENSPMIPLSFRDIFKFCYLEQEELDSSFFRLNTPILAEKSKDALNFFTGYYSDILSALETQLDQLRIGSTASRQFASFNMPTKWKSIICSMGIWKQRHLIRPKISIDG
jgi:Cap4 dsDNA endonuclease